MRRDASSEPFSPRQRSRAFAEGTHRTARARRPNAQLARDRRNRTRAIGAWETLDPEHVRREAQAAPTSEQWPGRLGGHRHRRQGHHRHRGPADQGGLADLRRLSAGRRCLVRRAAAGRGRVRIRQDGHHAVRIHGSRQDAQSAEHPSTRPADRRRARPRRSPRATSSPRSARRPTARSSVPRRIAAWSASSRPSARSRSSACIRSAPRSTPSARSPQFVARRRHCSRASSPSRAASQATSFRATHRPRLAWLARFPWSEADAASMQVLDAGARPPARRRRDRADRHSRSVAARRSTFIARSCFAKASTMLGELQERERARLTPGPQCRDRRRPLDRAYDRYRDALRRARARDRVLHRMARRASMRCWRPSAPGTAPRGPRQHRRPVLLHAVVVAGLSRAQPSRGQRRPPADRAAARRTAGARRHAAGRRRLVRSAARVSDAATASTCPDDRWRMKRAKRHVLPAAARRRAIRSPARRCSPRAARTARSTARQTQAGQRRTAETRA